MITEWELSRLFVFTGIIAQKAGDSKQKHLPGNRERTIYNLYALIKKEPEQQSMKRCFWLFLFGSSFCYLLNRYIML